MKICVIIVLMMVLNIPRFMLYKVVPNKEKGPGNYHYEYTAFRRSQIFVVISWVYSAAIQVSTSASPCFRSDRLVGLVVKTPASRAEGPGFESRLRRDFSGVESHQ